jgi:hydrogenase maturation protein HypF
VAEKKVRARLTVKGVVQGVGFRPYVYRLAISLGLGGWVKNTPRGVVIEVEGGADAVKDFSRRLPIEAPVLARVADVSSEQVEPSGEAAFSIARSEGEALPMPIVPADAAVCRECAAEVSNPSDRRSHYPFTNCTDCGPRFTIIEGLPYDRPLTTMKAFEMCPACSAEYRDPANRRFHAQPNACPKCGPALFWDGARRQDALELAARSLAAGEVVAVKGLGGYHLACDARNGAALERLRERKGRGRKPFAVMSRDIEEVRRFCRTSDEAVRILQSPQAPIVLLDKSPGPGLAPGVAPGLHRYGVMLPYSPLHRLLMQASPPTLVMTSGNLSEEPIVHEDDAARRVLGHIADHFLSHDRPIAVPCDDSVVAILNGKPLPVRRSRGYAPIPIEVGLKGPEVLAVGGDQKNTFCLLRDGFAVLSQHVGDLENAETVEYLGRAIEHFKQLFEVEPQIVAHDLHPDYASSRLARSFERVKLVAVQHHHAHAASAMVDAGLKGPVIAVAFDGTGYGGDGTIWGGEILVADLRRFERAAHLATIRLPGGEASIRKPARMALAYLEACFGEEGLQRAREMGLPLSEGEMRVVAHQCRTGLNSPLASSVGRLFDAVSALLGNSPAATYEGQAAAELEALAHEHGLPAKPFPYNVSKKGRAIVFDLLPAVAEIAAGAARGDSREEMAARFHETLAQCTAHVCRQVSDETAITDVVLCGGVFQNLLLTKRLLELLEERKMKGYVHDDVPTNDGGLSLGQAAVASAVAQE